MIQVQKLLWSAGGGRHKTGNSLLKQLCYMRTSGIVSKVILFLTTFYCVLRYFASINLQTGHRTRGKKCRAWASSVRNLSSEKAFQEETLYWLLFAIIYAKWAPVFKHRNKIRLCPVQACQKKSTITLEGLKWFVFLLPLSQALNGDKLNFSSWFLFRDHCNRDLYNSCVLPTPTYSCITALSTQCKTPHLSLCWNVKVYATCDTLSQDCCVIHTMMEEKRLQSMPVTEFFTSYSSAFQQTATFFFIKTHRAIRSIFLFTKFSTGNTEICIMFHFIQWAQGVSDCKMHNYVIKNSKIQLLHSLYITCITDEELLYTFILINKYVCPWQLRNKT